MPPKAQPQIALEQRVRQAHQRHLADAGQAVHGLFHPAAGNDLADLAHGHAALPLVRPPENEAGGAPTKQLWREHAVLVARSGPVTVPVGKWTTCRSMAEDVLDQAMMRFAARHEMAHSVAHVLARRCRLLFLDAAEAARQADAVATVVAEELGRDIDTRGFKQLAAQLLAAQYQRLPLVPAVKLGLQRPRRDARPPDPGRSWPAGPRGSVPMRPGRRR